MITPNVLQRLGSLFQRRRPEAAAPAPAPAPASAPPPAAAPAPAAESVAPSAAPMASQGGQASTAAVLADPIVAGVTQELASEQAQPVPTEDEQLQAEQHPAWAAYDFERCIVIFSRLLELHPGDADYKEKLVASYFNRGKQYEADGNVDRAVQLYYSALALDPDFGPGQEAAQALLAKHEA